MNCELAQEQIVLASYGELADELAPALEHHLASCAACREERARLAALRLLADSLPVSEPDANLVARARMRLDDALDQIPAAGWLERRWQQMRNGWAALAAAPVTAGLLVVLGLGAGVAGGWRLGTAQAAKLHPEAAAEVNAAEIANVQSVSRQANSGRVEVTYSQVVAQKAEGSIDDPHIRQLLLLASAHGASAGVRDDSVALLAAACKAGNGCQGAEMRDALIVALRYDKSVTVREKALKGLGPFVARDVQVRDAVLEALLNDTDARIRSAAISLLEPVEADTSVREVLQAAARTDRSAEIRLVSQKVLSQVPEIQ